MRGPRSALRAREGGRISVESARKGGAGGPCRAVLGCVRVLAGRTSEAGTGGFGDINVSGQAVPLAEIGRSFGATIVSLNRRHLH
jgi:hypothetical protein